MNIAMSVWRERTDKIITAFGDSSAVIEAFYKKRGSSVAFQKISGEFVYQQDEIWELTTSFDIGEYIIKIVIDSYPVFVYLNVVTAEEYTHTINQHIMMSNIDKIIEDTAEIVDMTNIINARI